jgi:hypothetical protein
MAQSFIYNEPPAELFVFEGVWQTRAPAIKSAKLGIGFVEAPELLGVVSNTNPIPMGAAIDSNISAYNIFGILTPRHFEMGAITQGISGVDVVGVVANPGIGRAVIDNTNHIDIRAHNQPQYRGVSVLTSIHLPDLSAHNKEQYLGIANAQIYQTFDAHTKPLTEFIGSGCVAVQSCGDFQAVNNIVHLGDGIVANMSAYDVAASNAHIFLGTSVTLGTHDDVFGLPAYIPVYLGESVVIGDKSDIIGPLDPVFLGIANNPHYNERDVVNGGGGGGNYGPYLRFTCATDTIELVLPPVAIRPDNWLFSNLSSYSKMLLPHANRRAATASGTKNLGLDKNNPNFPEKEAPRLLTHLIFDPITKPALSTYYLTYTLDVGVEQTPDKTPSEFKIPDEQRYDSSYEYHSTLPSNTWTIHHQLGYIPKVVVFIDGMVYTDAKVSHYSENTTIIQFTSSKMGVARLS